MKIENQGLTPKMLMSKTGINLNQLVYLRRMNRLPILKYSSGPGYPTLYDIKAIDVVKSHLNKA